MPNALLEELVDAATAKAGPQVDSAVDRLGGEAELDSMELLLAGIHAKEAGFPDAAIRVFHDPLRLDAARLGEGAVRPDL